MSNEICPRFEKATQLLGKRWNSLIIHQLLNGPKKFSELESVICLSAKVLSQRLKELEDDGVIDRVVYPETPVRIEYRLTSMGESLKSVMESIEEWATKWY